MKQALTAEESKAVLLTIMDSIDSCCRINGLKYSLTFGTLLGAVRHKGFIPWDDDLDLMMEREQLNKFLEVYDDPRFEVISNSNPLWGWHYIRICDKGTQLVFENSYESVISHGLWVAIFPIDNMPINHNEWNHFFKKISFCTNLCRLKRSKWAPTGLLRNVGKWIGRLCLLPFSRPLLAQMEERSMCKFNKINSDYCFIKVIAFFTYPKTVLDNYIDLEFEGYSFMSISGYDDFLRITYHDYWQLPPQSERIPRHGYTAYRK